MFFDPTYLLLFFAALGVAWLARWQIDAIYRETDQVAVRSGVSGAEAAAAVLHSAGANAVYVEDSAGQQLDHYSPAEKGVRLRPEVYDGKTLFAVGIAAHETGHALQDAAGYRPLKAREFVVQSATVGSLIGLIMFVGGFLLIESILIYFGIFVFCLTVAVQLANLVVEFDASRRAHQYLMATGVVAKEEEPAVRRAMRAAAITYLASTVTVIPTVYNYLAGLVRRYREQQRRRRARTASVAERPVLVADVGQPMSGAAVGGLQAAMERLRRRSTA
jgi:Zn-dependent membrane protease YugP